MMSAAPRKQINISVDPRMHAKLQVLANAASMSLTSYAALLLDAAYAARCGETGDVALDTAVSRVALLFGTGFDIGSIHQATGLSETFVDRAVEAWQIEMRREPAAIVQRVRPRQQGRAAS